MAKILIVEDSEQLGEMLVERLQRRGHAVLLATNKDDALSSAKASQPDVILLEQQLRGADDWATARALKYDDHTREIPIIALLASNLEEAGALARQNGCQELHAKPIDFVRLLQQIDAVTAPEPAAPGNEEP